MSSSSALDLIMQQIKEALIQTDINQLIVKLVDSQSGREIHHFPIANLRESTSKPRSTRVAQGRESQIQQLQLEIEKLQQQIQELQVIPPQTTTFSTTVALNPMPILPKVTIEEKKEAAISNQKPAPIARAAAHEQQQEQIVPAHRVRQLVDRYTEVLPTPTKTVTKRRGVANVATTESDSSTDEEESAVVQPSPTKRSRAVSTSVPDDKACEEAEEIQMLVNKLKNAYQNRQYLVQIAEQDNNYMLNREQLLNLGVKLMELNSDSCNEKIAVTYREQISQVITRAQSVKMIGYYYLSILAHKLKTLYHHHSYTRKVHQLLGYKSPADVAAIARFYEFVQVHYQAQVQHFNTLLEIPIFMAEISWTDWRRYMTKPHRHLIDIALERFKVLIAPFQDWSELNWIEVYELPEKVGQFGVRATRDIPYDPLLNVSIRTVADLKRNIPTLTCAQLSPEKLRYSIMLSKNCYADIGSTWIGKLNHLPMKHCNLRLTSDAKLQQIRTIRVGEELTFDYSEDYWVYHVTGLEMKEWIQADDSCESNKARLALFRCMHTMVLDYTGLLNLNLQQYLTKRKSREASMDLILKKLETYLHKHHRTPLSDSDVSIESELDSLEL